jgi:membrane fusion protein (multidrug efflux system)
MFVVLVVALLAVGAVVFAMDRWLQTRDCESTDDAFIDGPIIPISPKVPGRLVQVLVHENQEVKEGDLLVQIDPQDYEVAAVQRQAALEVAQAKCESAQSGVAQATAHIRTLQEAGLSLVASVAAAESEALKSLQDLRRFERLEKTGVLSVQDLEHTSATKTSDAAKLQSTQKEAAAANAYLEEAAAQKAVSDAQLRAAEAEVRAAEADLSQAKLQLAYAGIRAPQDGRVTRKAAEPGAYAQVAQTLFSLVPRELWVTANFKETQLREMQPGQPVEIEIDAYNRTLRGHVDSIMAGSGARFSLLPPENATGNFVKVVQRVPVKILFDEPSMNLIGPGMSVVPTVRVRNSTGSGAILAVTALVAVAITAFIVRRTLRG